VKEIQQQSSEGFGHLAEGPISGVKTLAKIVVGLLFFENPTTQRTPWPWGVLGEQF